MMEDDLLELDLVSPPPVREPLVGASAALGTAVGLGIASIAASAWSRLEQGTWSFNNAPQRTRVAIAVAFMGSAAIGALMGSRKNGNGLPAFVGASLGVAISQIPLILDPALVADRPIVGNLWQFGVPVAFTVLAVNVTKAKP